MGLCLIFKFTLILFEKGMQFFMDVCFIIFTFMFCPNIIIYEGI